MIILRDKLFVAASYRNHKQKKEADLKKAEIKFQKAKKNSKKAEKSLLSNEYIRDPKIESNLINQASKLNATVHNDDNNVIDIDPLKSSVYTNKEAVDSLSVKVKAGLQSKNPEKVKDARGLGKDIKEGKNIIRFPIGSGEDSLAHEIGHLQFDKAGGREPKKDILEDKKAGLKEEHEASRYAIGNLRRAGASKKILKQSKSNLRKMEKTYRYEKDRIRYARKLGRDPNEQ